MCDLRAQLLLVALLSGLPRPFLSFCWFPTGRNNVFQGRDTFVGHPCPVQDLLLRCMTDAALGANQELAGAPTALGEDEVADVLALRGLLACGVL